VWCFGVSSVYSFDLLYSLLFGHITVITITHVMRMAHMHHHSSWFLVCETIRERRRRHHRDHGWPQAADTPSFRFFGPPTRPTTQTPHNTQQSRGVQDRGTPGQMNAGARTARHQARAHFAWVLRSSRQVGAGSRGRVTTDGSPAPHQNSVMSQNSGAPVQRRATQPRPCARADTTRPATANYPPVCRECNKTFIPSRCAHHITTSLHITSHAPTELTGVVSQGTGKLVLRSHAAGKHVF